MEFIRHQRSSAGLLYQVVRSDPHGGTASPQVLVSLAHNPTIREAIAYIDSTVSYSERKGWRLDRDYARRLQHQRQLLLATQRETNLP